MMTPRTLRRPAALALLCASIAMLCGAGPAGAAPPAHVRNIVLVHGAFTDGSCWQEVTSLLQAAGYHVSAVQNPLASLADDVLATERVLQRQQGGVLLVGHSWGGAVITQAGNAANVKGLVYLSALAPDQGESVQDLLARVKAPMNGLQPDAHGLVWLDDGQRYRQVMAGDVPLRRVQGLAAAQQPIAALSFAGKIHHPAWRDKPSWYLQTTSDQALAPAVQGAIASHIGARVVSLASSHLSMVAQPEQVARLIDQAARQLP